MTRSPACAQPTPPARTTARARWTATGPRAVVAPKATTEPWTATGPRAVVA
ncbi:MULTISPECIES: hypothetical protein [unclassified Streptomyces]|uniref:hypothetical protein n=1 Tax=unclassified Streptomyces TaxID=2593676 RepID=UPI00168C047F|nr:MULTISPECIES: hypothetical protein [unclassified Streptomyces]MBD3007737.1 hypothetical protein [Streptomyces sp. 5-10]